jgi:subtilisin family serine protease
MTPSTVNASSVNASSVKAVARSLLLSVGLVICGAAVARAAGDDEPLIVRCTRPCAAVARQVAAAGGSVVHVYQNVDAVAVRVPKGALPSLVSLAGASAVAKDVTVPRPRRSTSAEVTGQHGNPIVPSGQAAAEIANYNYNLGLTNVAPLHAEGKFGQNVVVAVIDSGTVNVPTIVELTGTVIGGESFVAGDPLSATHRENDWHGTAVADMIAAHGALLFSNASPLVGALTRYAPDSALPCASVPGTCGLPPAVAAGVTLVPMTGTAPGARIYAMKVFGAGEPGGSPTSRLVAAMDRAITLRRNYNTTGANTVASGTGTETDPFVYSSLKIDVVNMSLGGVTLFPGRDVMDDLSLAMLDVGITLVTSAGNEGPAAITGGSPGTGFGSLTVGAASSAVHERVVTDLQYGPGAGEVYRPTTHLQTADFSSRGPTADGRVDPELLANGVASFIRAFFALTAAGGLADCRAADATPGTCQPRLVFVYGTSFSSPTVAGAAAVLRGAQPTRSAAQVRNALVRSANPDLLGDDSTRIDQGRGFLDVAAADAMLAGGHVSSRVSTESCGHIDDDDELGAGGCSVMRNVQKLGLDIARFQGDRYTTTLRNLKPGEVAHIFLPSDPFTRRFDITVDRVRPALPPEQQNQFFLCGDPGEEFICGDDLYVTVVDAPTQTNEVRVVGFVNSQDTLTARLDHPQTGLVRIALMGDWTNAGLVSARLTVTRRRQLDGLPTKVGTIEQDETRFVEVDVPAGADNAVFEVAWKQNWGRYPTNDIDLLLIDPEGNVDPSGATLNSPERVEIANPTPGRWTAAIMGFTVWPLPNHHRGDPEAEDLFTFRAEADGRRLRAR